MKELKAAFENYKNALKFFNDENSSNITYNSKMMNDFYDYHPFDKECEDCKKSEYSTKFPQIDDNKKNSNDYSITREIMKKFDVIKEQLKIMEAHVNDLVNLEAIEEVLSPKHLFKKK
jgi:hypothetical protein